MPQVNRSRLVNASGRILLIVALTAIWAARGTAASGSPYTVTYKPGLQMDVYPGTLPRVAVLVIHGGGWRNQGRRGKPSTVCPQLVQPLGLTCLAPDFRLSRIAPFPAANNDLLAAVRWAHDHGYSWLGAIGLSSGGNLAGWLATQRELVTTVIWSGITDLRNVVPEGWTDGKEKVADFAPTKADKIAASPALNANDGMGSMLIFNSTHELIPLAQAQEMSDAMTTEHDMIVFHGSRHSMGYFYRAKEPTQRWLITHLLPAGF